MPDEKLKNLVKKYNKPENCSYVFAPKFYSEIWNKNFTTDHKGHDIGLQKIQIRGTLLKQLIRLQTHVIEEWIASCNQHFVNKY